MPKFKLPSIKIPTGKSLTILLLVVCAVFVSSITLAFSYFTTAGFCNFCHSMSGEYQSWQKSSHAKLPCLACHLSPGGGVTLIKDHVMSGKLVLAEFVTGYEKPVNAESKISQEHIEVEQCERCHSPENRNFTPKVGLTMDQKAHLKHLRAGLRCTTCHNRITHKSMDEPGIKYNKGEKDKKFKYKNLLTMKEGCWRCHSRFKPYKSPVNGAAAPTKCSTCHTKEWKLMPDFHKALSGKTWKQRHGKIARQDMKFCQNCHENKGEIGAQTGIKTCYSCHKVVVPHDTETKNENENWDKIHYLQKDRALCQRCHKDNAPQPNTTEAKDPDFCQKCHHRRFAQAAKDLNIDQSKLRWKKIHFRIVKENGAQDCFQCHNVVFCSQCHIRGKKPAPGVFTKFNKDFWSSDHQAWLK